MKQLFLIFIVFKYKYSIVTILIFYPLQEKTSKPSADDLLAGIFLFTSPNQSYYSTVTIKVLSRYVSAFKIIVLAPFFKELAATVRIS